MIGRKFVIAELCLERGDLGARIFGFEFARFFLLQKDARPFVFFSVGAKSTGNQTAIKRQIQQSIFGHNDVSEQARSDRLF